MVLDSSAILSILFDEDDADDLIAKLETDKRRCISTVTWTEASMLMLSRLELKGQSDLDDFIEAFQVEIISVDYEQARLAREAFRTYGKGRHKASLNFGDCFSYALAKQTGEPLLYKGNDFSRTDILPA